MKKVANAGNYLQDVNPRTAKRPCKTCGKVVPFYYPRGPGELYCWDCDPVFHRNILAKSTRRRIDRLEVKPEKATLETIRIAEQKKYLKAMREASPGQREIVHDLEVLNLSFAEIAIIRGVSEVATRRAVNRLKDRFVKIGLPEPIIGGRARRKKAPV